ncbi:MAG TPA: exopolysaccharide biosynthesis polyprenyl glycosylphosphotransferase [Egibacteraceae bacterium]|nr:exopolysaccharide biosynthesis polyprenyl glycosylphosphotransferase [Egibacteraceae bacterium]
MKRDAGSRTGRRPAPPGQPRLLTRLRAGGFRLLMAADAAALLVVMVGVNLVRFGTSWPTYPLSTYALGFVGATAIHLVVYYFGGLYEPEQRLGVRPALPRVAMLTALAVLLVAAVWLAVGRYPGGRANLVALLVLGSLALTGNRHLARSLRVQREGPPRVLLVGPPDDVNLARSHLRDYDRTTIVVGYTGSRGSLLEAVEDTDATDVLLLTGRMLDEVYPEPLTTLARRGVGVQQRVGAHDTLLGLRGVREIAGMPFVALGTHTLPVSRARFKRVLELVGVVAALPVTLPALAALAAYVRIVAGPPVLFRQNRVGREGRVFALVKLRTMYPHAEDGLGPVLAGDRDVRVVPACRWLRATRLDELPQLWNVLRGEMSVVGPRPERPELTAQYEQLIPGYSRRHEIPPGITGLAQIHGRYHTDPEFKLGHDLQYLVNWSPVLDLEILARTVWVVLTRRV